MPHRRGLMIDMRATNEKLRKRGVWIGCDLEEARKALDDANRNLRGPMKAVRD